MVSSQLDPHFTVTPWHRAGDQQVFENEWATGRPEASSPLSLPFAFSKQPWGFCKDLLGPCIHPATSWALIALGMVLSLLSGLFVPQGPTLAPALPHLSGQHEFLTPGLCHTSVNQGLAVPYWEEGRGGILHPQLETTQVPATANRTK